MIPTDESGDIATSSIGFGDPTTAPPYSPALKRQVALLTNDQGADYFLFDKDDRPVRFFLLDGNMRMVFRLIRQGLLSTPGQIGLEALAEQMIKDMARRPGLSRQLILAQLEREFESGIEAKLLELERKERLKGLEGTMIENMAKGMQTLPSIKQHLSRG